MFSVKVEGHFSSAHNLRGYKGKCEALHGHNWKVQVVAVADELDTTGMVMDFTVVKAALKKVLEPLDHTYLNNIPYFKKANPTSERIAQYIFSRLKPAIAGLHSVTVWESENASATYHEK